tara:strand:+ start:793 stop:1473 length:681 start_codon:yes stop_codon:yes gene_type:complete
MKIGINLNGVSYHDGSSYRKRIYTDSIDNLMKNVVNPLKEKGHEVSFYVFTYDTEKSKDVERDYNPVKSTYVSESYKFNQATSGDRLSNGWRMMTITTVNSLHQLKEEDLDLVISTRFDINFKQNPFEVYDYDFTKCSFLWREPEFMDLPIVNDTFIVFPYHMLDNMIESFVEQEVNPPGGVNPGNHNLYVPMVKRVGEDNVVWVQEGFGEKTVDNDLYKLEREEK